MVKKIMALTLLFAAFSAAVMPTAWAKGGVEDLCPHQGHGDECDD